MSKKSAKRSPPRKSKNATIDEAMRFLEDSRLLFSGNDEATKAISIRVPANVLRAFKTKAKVQEKKYQSVIITLMRKWIGQQNG